MIIAIGCADSLQQFIFHLCCGSYILSKQIAQLVRVFLQIIKLKCIRVVRVTGKIEHFIATFEHCEGPMLDRSKGCIILCDHWENTARSILSPAKTWQEFAFDPVG